MSEKSRLLVGLAALTTLALAAGPRALHATGEVPLSWHTYAGSQVDDDGSGIAVDPAGNVYFTGWSDATWGSPIQGHSGGRDNFVAKLKSTGQLEWNTFLGPSGSIQENAIAVDGGGNVFAVGTAASALDWGQFVAKLDSSGQLLWRHLGAETYWGVATSVAVDVLGSIYVGGWGGCQTGPSLIGSAWVAKLDSSGADVWHTCLGWIIADDAFAEVRTVAVDASGSVYATGRSTLSWGAPVNPHAGGDDAFVAKLGPDGSLAWTTFMGGPGFDVGSGVALDASGNVYSSGSSDETWGTPVEPHAGPGGFVVKLDSGGSRLWHRFVGMMGWALAVDRGANVYVTGIAPSFGFVAALSPDGALRWNTPVAAGLDEMALGQRHVYVAGSSGVTFGTPVHPRAGGWDAFVAKFASVPLPTDFYTVPPCRLLDTRTAPGGALRAGETRAIAGTVGACAIPSDAVALALNVTVTQPTAAGNLRLYATGDARPQSSTINYAAAQTRANNAVVGLSESGSLSVYCSQSSGSAHLVVDVNGYFK